MSDAHSYTSLYFVNLFYIKTVVVFFINICIDIIRCLTVYGLMTICVHKQ